MPHQLDGLDVELVPVATDLCPICEKAKHDTTQDKKDGKGDLESKPANLGCTALVPRPDLPNYTTAAHHLIPAMQCLAKFPRLSQMCDAVGYDVNNKQNGMSLPTVGQQEENVYTGGKKYGKLPLEEKIKVSFVIMEMLNLQWHVGHHDWVPLKLNTDNEPHPPNYDKLVKVRLRKMEKDIKNKGAQICDPEKDE